MKLIITLVLLLNLSACYNSSPSQREELVNTTVKIESQFGSGSGVIVAKKGYILFIVTNQHVVSIEKTTYFASFPFFHYQNEPIKIIKIDAKKDLALVTVNPGMDLPVNIKPICTKQPIKYSPVIAVGSGLGLPIYTTKGEIINPLVIVSDLNHLTTPIFIQHTADIVPGNSGGPLFNKQNSNYCITGINSYSGASLIQLAIPAFVIQDFIKGVF